MKLIYPVVVRKNNEHDYEAYFPDLDQCRAFGTTIDEVMDAANAAALEWIEVELMEEDGFLPPVSDIEDLSVSENEEIRSVSLTLRLTDSWDE